MIPVIVNLGNYTSLTPRQQRPKSPPLAKNFRTARPTIHPRKRQQKFRAQGNHLRRNGKKGANRGNFRACLRRSRNRTTSRGNQKEMARALLRGLKLQK